MDLIEQAIFTSARTARAHGYQVVASSPGMSESDRRALTAWGPSEGALADQSPDARSINFHPLPSGNLCIALTTAAGPEYSGRGGVRYCTQSFAVPPAILSRFANNPLALVDVVVSGGRLRTDAEPEPLESFSLVGRASAVDTLLLSELSLHPGPLWMAALIEAALRSATIAVGEPPGVEKIVAGLFSCLPPACRIEYYFSTGLRFSPRWPYRVIALPSSVIERRQMLRSCQAAVLDFSGDPPEQFAPVHPWARLVYQVLARRRISWFARQMSQYPAESPTADPAELALPILDKVT